MNKLIPLLALFLFSTFSFSQLSNKHWIPPLHANEGGVDGSLVGRHYLYLSTPSTIPFSVSVKDGSGIDIVPPVTISQGVPAKIEIGDSQPSVMMLSDSDVGIVKNNKGIILEGLYDFYASFRISSQNHAEILSSKGKSGAGTTFRLGSLPQNEGGSIRNFVSSFIATEDNTDVTISDYSPDVVFIQGNNTFSSPSQTFHLNEGESVVISGNAGFGDFTNFSGFVGALVNSTKPIVVNTGNLTGGMLDSSSGQDFNLDQIVPLEQVGMEYIVMKGNGSDNTEHPLVIAHEDNTEIFLNGSTTSISTINAGEYFLVPPSYFIGSGNNKNMFIQTSKPVFLYQIIAGSNSDATSGFYFIPPLSCFWQKSVDLIPDVDRTGNPQETPFNGGIIIATETFKPDGTPTDVFINGAPISTTANVVTGNSNWKTYKVTNLTGNVAVTSDRALAVGVFGASGAAGYGGYFSGFGSIPDDTSIELCSGSIVDLFNKIPGNPEPGGDWSYNGQPRQPNNGLFNPNIDGLGDYTYTFTKECNNIERVYPITVTVTNIIQGPNAGVSSNQSFCNTDTITDLNTLLGTNITPNGQWTYNGVVRLDGMFDPANDLAGNYTYTLIDSNGVCDPAVATLTITINASPEATIVNAYEVCDTNDDNDDTNGFTTFILDTNNTAIIDNQTDIVSIKYFELLADAEINNSSAALSNSYYSNSKTIYYRIENANGCYAIGTLDLIVNSLPTSVSEITLKQCDTDTDAITSFNLTEANSLISSDSDIIFSYHNSLIGAENNNDYVPNEINHIAANGSIIWARIETDKGCYRTVKINLMVSATTVSQNFSFPIEECDDFIDPNDPDGDGIDYFDLTQIESTLINQFPTTQSYTFSYYLNETDALTEQNSITDISSFRNTIPNYQEIWVRMESNLYECAALGPYLKLTVNPLPDTDLGSNFFLCINPSTGLGSQIIDATPATSGNYSYQWSSNIPNLDLSAETTAQYNVTQEGTYTVTVTNNNTSCIYIDEVTATYSSEPLIYSAEISSPAFSSEITIIVNASGGYGSYEYSLDLTNWQSDPIFSNLPNGNYTVYIKDINGCGTIIIDNLISISFPSLFTPNGDGYNDTWNIPNLPSEYEAKIFIFDRYGKLLKQISPNGNGWDGTYNGSQLPSTDYWFKVEYKINGSEQEFKSHFSLKR